MTEPYCRTLREETGVCNGVIRAVAIYGTAKRTMDSPTPERSQHHIGHSNPRGNDTPAATEAISIVHHHTYADATGIDEELAALKTAGSGPDQVAPTGHDQHPIPQYVDGVLTDGTVIPLMRLR